jgi:hypothetical protein
MPCPFLGYGMLGLLGLALLVLLATGWLAWKER